MAQPVTLQLVLEAISTLQAQAASSQERIGAAAYLEHVKRGDAHNLLQIAVALGQQGSASGELQVTGYSLLTDLVSHSLICGHQGMTQGHAADHLDPNWWVKGAD